MRRLPNELRALLFMPALIFWRPNMGDLAKQMEGGMGGASSTPPQSVNSQIPPSVPAEPVQPSQFPPPALGALSSLPPPSLPTTPVVPEPSAASAEPSRPMPNIMDSSLGSLSLVPEFKPIPPVALKIEEPKKGGEPFSNPLEDTAGVWSKVRVTGYSEKEPGGDRAARPNIFGKDELTDRTIAVDPSVIPFGSIVAIRNKDGTITYHEAHDTGSAVKSKEATGGKIPVIDQFVRGGNGLTDFAKVDREAHYRVLSKKEADKIREQWSKNT